MIFRFIRTLNFTSYREWLDFYLIIEMFKLGIGMLKGYPQMHEEEMQ